MELVEAVALGGERALILAQLLQEPAVRPRLRPRAPHACECLLPSERPRSTAPSIQIVQMIAPHEECCGECHGAALAHLAVYEHGTATSDRPVHPARAPVKLR